MQGSMHQGAAPPMSYAQGTGYTPGGPIPPAQSTHNYYQQQHAPPNNQQSTDRGAATGCLGTCLAICGGM